MTDKTDPIAHAARLLREAAQELQQGHTLRTTPNDWTGEPEAKAAYDEHMGAAAALECWAEAIGAGGVSGPLMGQPQAMPDLSALTERGAKAWAGVDAQGLRDGVASAGSEPVAWVDERALSWLANSRSLSATITTKLEKGKSFERPMPLYTHPSPPEGMVGGWISVKERLPPPFEEVVVYPRPDDYCCEAFCDTAGKWKWAEYEHNFGVHHRECQVEYWLMLPEVPVPPTSSADSRKGE